MAGDMVEVELDDEEPTSAARRRRRARARRRSPRPWSRAALGLALLLAAGAFVDGAAARRFVDPPPGLVGDLRVTRGVLWRAGAGAVLGVVGDTLVVGAVGGRGVLARDVSTGHVTWHLPLGGCRLVDTSATEGQPVDAVVAPQDARLVCEEMPTTQTTTVTIADAARGTVLASFADGGDSPDVSTSGRVAVVSEVLPSGQHTLSVYSLETGRHLWGAGVDGHWSGRWYVQDDTLVVLDPTWARDVDSGAAVPVPEPVQQAPSPRSVHDDGREPGRAPAAPVLLGEVRGTRVLAERDGVDESGVATDTLVGRDGRTGEVLWHVPSSELTAVTSDGRRFLVPAPDGVLVRDLRSGGVVARWPVGPGPGGASTRPPGGAWDDGGSEPALAGLWRLPGGRLAWTNGAEVVVLGL